MRCDARAACRLLLLLTALAVPAAAQQDTTRVRPDTLALTPDSLVGRPDTAATADTAKKNTDVSAQDSPEDRGLLIRTADRALQLRILGSIRVFGSYDFEGLPRADAFSPYEVPVTAASGADRFYMDARQTRLGFETLWRKSDSSHTVFARIEADFAGPSNAFRLRHAYVRIDLNRIVLGQTWTAFTDITAVPLTVDLDGPASSVTLRSTQVRYTHTLAPGLTLAGSVESPSADVLTTAGTTDDTYQSFPDMVAQVRYQRPGLRVQGAAVLRQVSVALDSVTRQRVVGAGIMGSVLWTMRPGRDLGAQLIAGKGISKYLTGLSGRGLDLIFDPEIAEYTAPWAMGGYVSYSFAPRKGWTANAIVGMLSAPAQDFYADDAYNRGGTAAGNVFVPVFPGMLAGLEAVWGWRRNVDGQSGTAFRLQARVTYDF
jgi:hypothetical protein